MITGSQLNRRLVPHWRGLNLSTNVAELAMPPSAQEEPVQRAFEPDFIKRIERFRRQPSLVHAAELVESAGVLGFEAEAVRAARVLLRDTNTVALVRTHAERLMRRTGNGEEFETDGPGPLSSRPVPLRAGIRLNPADAVGWVELALVQFCKGHVEHARRSMTASLQLAPSNRHVLRSAARFFFQIKDYDRAHDLVRRSEVTRGDPWLMAAEVALSGFAEKRSTFMKQGLHLLELERLPPTQITELAGAVGTQLLVDGGGRLGRKLMRQSQIAPTTNAVAQAEWVSLHMGADVVAHESDFPIFRRSWEAMFLHAFYVGGDLRVALDCAGNWVKEEPYNAFAYAFAASAANVIEDFETARTISKAGLDAARNSELIYNSIAFAEACLGHLDSAEMHAAKVPDVKGDLQSLVATANRGLIAMRRGQLARAKSLYNEAIAGFKRAGSKDFEASALAYFASELLRVDEQDECRMRLEEAKKLNTSIKRPHIEIVARRVEQRLEECARRSIPLCASALSPQIS
jgi:hypothetical protein